MGSIFVDTDGKIYVVDGGNARLARMDEMTGTGWITLGTYGTGPSQFISPNTVFVSVNRRLLGAQRRARP